MSFESLIDKVKQAESALEAKERETGADWRQLAARLDPVLRRGARV